MSDRLRQTNKLRKLEQHYAWCYGILGCYGWGIYSNTWTANSHTIPDSLCLNRIYSQQALSLQQCFIWWKFVRIISFDETWCYLTHSTREFTSNAHFITAPNWAAHRSNYKVTFSKSATGSASLILHAVFAFIILHRHGSLNTYAKLEHCRVLLKRREKKTDRKVSTMYRNEMKNDTEPKWWLRLN